MTNFSTNQVMQFYVASSSDVASIKAIPGRGITMTIGGKRTDIIENILWGKLTKASALATPLKQTVVAFAAGEAVIPGERYVVRVSYPEILGAGVESWATQTAVYTAKDDDAPTAVYTALVAQLAKTLPAQLEAKVADGVVILPKVNTANYKRGINPVVVPEFAVSTSQVVKKGEESTWATITDSKSAASINGSFKLADMEYFALGECGDEYRQMGWPNVIHTEYKINPSDLANYDVLVVHYGFKGDNANSHLAEKDLVIAGTSAEVLAIAKAIQSAADVKFTMVPGSSDKEDEVPAN